MGQRRVPVHVVPLLAPTAPVEDPPRHGKPERGAVLPSGHFMFSQRERGPSCNVSCVDHRDRPGTPDPARTTATAPHPSRFRRGGGPRCRPPLARLRHRGGPRCLAGTLGAPRPSWALRNVARRRTIRPRPAKRTTSCRTSMTARERTPHSTSPRPARRLTCSADSAFRLPTALAATAKLACHRSLQAANTLVPDLYDGTRADPPARTAHPAAARNAQLPVKEPVMHVVLRERHARLGLRAPGARGPVRHAQVHGRDAALDEASEADHLVAHESDLHLAAKRRARPRTRLAQRTPNAMLSAIAPSSPTRGVSGPRPPDAQGAAARVA